jgi:hypothetical protein
MIAGGGGSRHAEDFYSTPRDATVALLHFARPYIGPIVHEPACGSGALARVLVEYGYDVIATDLVDRGYGTGGIDFLRYKLRAKSSITNPPFKLAAEFIEHGCSQDPEFYALLLKATFWHAKSRAKLFDRFPPKMTLPLTWRLDFTDQGAPTMDCTWFIWGSRVPGPSAPALLERPRQPAGVFA